LIAESAADAAGRAGVTAGRGGGTTSGRAEAQETENSTMAQPAQIRMTFPVQGGSASLAGISGARAALLLRCRKHA
jgi:hypothetical protein